ncbi:uncharacterized protein LOC114245033 [Bombyx mandarina]|uniref:Uncharacterized protein LOC114245033 n=1 Tax=Bombyx mandarina TaxID=7092 RepID=A0A6J2JU83_BOMMA|nr:uncharacterized protein LOC114245033 [Bombyx mandarina]
MTKMNRTDMNEHGLSVDDIFSENYNVKRKRIQLESFDGKQLTKIDSGIEKSDEPPREDLKAKTKSYDDTEYDIDKIVQANMIIDKESSKTIRLELRQPGDGGTSDIDVQAVENLDPNNYTVKTDSRLNTGNEKNVDYNMNGCEDENRVSIYYNKDLIVTFET